MPGIIHFLHPEFLYGLTVLILPVILHFFSFKKYKKVYFSNFNFLQSLQQQRKNSSRLKNLLLLLMRLLALGAIVTAFACPYIAPRQTLVTPSEKNQVVIYADNSFSMSNTGTHSSLLEEAKKHLFDILNTYPAGTTFFLLTNDNQDLPALSKEETINAISALKVTPHTRTLSEIFRTARELSRDKKTTLFLLSDFQSVNCDFQQITADTLTDPVFLILQPENTNNLYIKDVQFNQVFHQKNQNDKITVTLVNSSDKDVHNVPVSLTINGKKKNVTKTHIPAQGEQTLEMNYLNTENGFYKGTVEITDIPVVFDNKFFFSYNIQDKINILCIEQKDHLPYFEKLFSDTTAFRFNTLNINQTANLRLNEYNLVILDRIEQYSSGFGSAIENYLKEGGNVFILPGGQRSVNLLNSLLAKLHAPQSSLPDSATTIARMEEQAALFKDVFEKQEAHTALPYVKKFYPIHTLPGTEKLLTDKKGNTLLAAQRSGQGNLYLSAFSYEPENSDMVYHPIFVPVMVNMSCNMNSNLNSSWFLNSDNPVYIARQGTDTDSRLVVRNEDNTLEFIPEIRKDFSGNLVMVNTTDLKEAGLYNVFSNGTLVDVIACNYDRKESRMQFCNGQEIQKHFPQARVESIRSTQFDHNSELVKEIVLQDNNHYIAVWFILLAILAVLLEQWIWKRKLT